VSKAPGVLPRTAFVRPNSGLQGDKNVVWWYYLLQNRDVIIMRNSAAFWPQKALDIGEIGQGEFGYMIDRESFPFAGSATLKVYISGH
jgi:hypothetical protein